MDRIFANLQKEIKKEGHMSNQKNLIAGKEIKPCPFCGKDEGEDSYDEERNRIIRCMNCGAVGPWAEQLSDAIEAWNERYE